MKTAEEIFRDLPIIVTESGAWRCRTIDLPELKRLLVESKIEGYTEAAEIAKK